MKTRYMILAAVAGLILAVPMALLAGGGDKVIGVAEALELEDDAKVILEGFIVEDLGGDLYLFHDGTGDIDLEIEKKTWEERVMNPDELVRVYGEIDRDDNLIKVEVREIKIVKDFHRHEDKIEEEIDEYIDEEFLE
jgi:uncharacterized protein (TIGR00156 family)